MNKEIFENLFSIERLHKYYDYFQGENSKAIDMYLANIKLSESLYTILSVTEIALRNSINRVLCKQYSTTDWFNAIRKQPELNEISIEIDAAIKKIIDRKEEVKLCKITAELTLGFWTSLFNSKYEKILWKYLRFAFPNLQKFDRQRHRVSAPINNIRYLRNRVFHYEPIIWNIQRLEKIIEDCYLVLQWINKDIPDYLKGLDNSAEHINKIKETYYKGVAIPCSNV